MQPDGTDTPAAGLSEWLRLIGAIIVPVGIHSMQIVKFFKVRIRHLVSVFHRRYFGGVSFAFQLTNVRSFFRFWFCCCCRFPPDWCIISSRFTCIYRSNFVLQGIPSCYFEWLSPGFIWLFSSPFRLSYFSSCLFMASQYHQVRNNKGY